MRAGKLPFLITIEEPIETRNTVGEAVKTWIYRGTVWGSIDPMPGTERFSVDQEKATVDTTIRIRGNAAPYLTPTMRMKHGDRVFDIDSIINANSRDILKEVYCQEVA